MGSPISPIHAKGDEGSTDSIVCFRIAVIRFARAARRTRGDPAGTQTQGQLSRGEQMKVVVEKFGGPGTYRTYAI
jgi:hypothetical protein